MKKLLKWGAILFVGFIVLGIIGAAFSDGTETNQNNSSETGAAETAKKKEPSKPKPGDTLKGIGREELEKKLQEQRKVSEIKADEYVESVKGEEVSWVLKVDNVEPETFGSGYQIRAKSGIYSVIIKDPNKLYGDIAKNDIIQVDGKIDDVNDILGVIVYIAPDDITKI